MIGCKHEYRQRFISKDYQNEDSEQIDYLDDDGYYCIHCLKEVKKYD